VPDEELERALIGREMLDYKQFSKFLKIRSEKMIQRVQHRLQFSDGDFRSSEEEE